MDKDNNDERVRLDRNDLKFDDNDNSTRACRSKEKQHIKRTRSINLVKATYMKHISCRPESTKLTTSLVMPHNSMKEDMIAMCTVAISFQVLAELRRRSSP
eukprot:15549927-Heterocapsa_arctica.AAC.1